MDPKRQAADIAGMLAAFEEVPESQRAAAGSATLIAWLTSWKPYPATTLAHLHVASGPPRMSLSAVALSYLTAGSSLIGGLGGTADFGETTLARTDDGSSAAIDITPVFGAGGLNFFGTAFTTLWVNNNGNITFNAASSTFTPTAINGGANNPIIAAFWADVDARGGAVSATPGGTSTGGNQVHYDLDTANRVFTATWDDVGYFNRKVNKLNAFQIQLLDETGGDFTIILRYEAVNWTTGDFSGGSNGLGGAPARAGWSAGNGRNVFELPGSGTQAAMLDLPTTPGNTGEDGVWVFRVKTAAAGNSSVQGGTTADIIAGSAGNNVILGVDGDDLLQGMDGADVMSGGAGNDTLEGGAGDDRMHGRAGNDLYRVDSQGDVVLEIAGEGDDTVEASSSYRLYPHIEHLILTAAAGASFGIGSAEANTITGNAANNTLLGGLGDDTVLGGDGADLVFGEGGADRLEGGTGADTLVGGLGDDSLRGGADADQMRGDGGRDTLDGGDAADVLAGGEGEDSLAGGSGADILRGDADNDTLSGDAGADALFGGEGDDSLLGGADADQLRGEGGRDTLEGGDGVDLLFGGEGDDSLLGGADADQLRGEGGNDTLQGGDGTDTLSGGEGDDTYVVDSLSDLILEAPGGGSDTVAATLSSGTTIYLRPEIEALVLGGTADSRGVGQELANRMTGNAGSNWLYGGDGDDTLLGAGGNDVLFGQAGADLFIIGADEGIDVIADFEPGVDRIELLAPAHASFAAMIAASTTLAAADVGSVAVIPLGVGHALRLRGVQVSELQAGDFLGF